MSNDSKDIIFQKEREWRELLVGKLERLEQEKQTCETDLKELNDKYFTIENDFKHNLRILQDRDDEIVDMENEITQLKDKLGFSETKISNLSVDNDKLKEEICRERSNVSNVKEKMRECSEKCSREIQKVKVDKNSKIDELSGMYNDKIKNLERQIIKMEAEAEEKNREILQDVQETLRMRETDLRREEDRMHSEVLAQDLRARLVARELDVVKAGRAELVGQLAEAEERVRELERTAAAVELAHASDMSAARLQRDTDASRSAGREAEVTARLERMAGKLDARDAAVRQKAALATRLEAEMQKVLAGKDADLESVRAEQRDSERRCEEADARAAEAERLVTRHRDEAAGRDGELRTARLELETGRTRMRQRQEELLELRTELEYAVGRDAEASRRREGEREDWEGRLEKVRVEEMARVEEMIRGLSRARDEALAEVRELRASADDHRKQVSICQRCSDQDRGKPDSAELADLRRQNERLKEVISSMTEEAAQQPLPQEIALLGPTKATTAATEPSIPVAVTHAATTNRHIASLAEHNRLLQQQRIDLLASVRQVQARLDGAQQETRQIKKTLSERDTEISQVRFELDSLQRHSGLDARSLRHRVQELETELAVSRREAEEYYKGNLELGRNVEELQTELTSLRSEATARVPSLNFGAQEMLIEQLRREIGKLRAPSRARQTTEHHGDDEWESQELRKKLKTAVNHIRNLSSEKQVLIQLSNRMRAELTKASIKLPQGSSHIHTTSSSRHDIRPASSPARNSRHTEGTQEDTIGALEQKLERLVKLQAAMRERCEAAGEEYIHSTRNVAGDCASSEGPGKSVEEAFRLLDDEEGVEDVPRGNVLWAEGRAAPITVTRRRPASSRRNVALSRK